MPIADTGRCDLCGRQEQVVSRLWVMAVGQMVSVCNNSEHERFVRTCRKANAIWVGLITVCLIAVLIAAAVVLESFR